MSDPATSPWWADVQHLREPAERRLRLAEPAADSEPADREDGRSSAEIPASEAQSEGGAQLHLVPSAPASAEWLAAERPSGRRTVVIRGQAIPAVSARPLIEVERRRPPRRPAERLPGRPDRIALWAVLLGLLLIAVTLITAHP